MPKVTSPVDKAITVFYSCFVDNYRLYSSVSILLALFLLPKVTGRRLRPLGCVKPDVTSPFDSLNLIWHRSVVEFFDYLPPFKSYSTFSICMYKYAF
jgi:hypothetical protein